jgi:hypothetical protein
VIGVVGIVLAFPALARFDAESDGFAARGEAAPEAATA